MSVWVGLGWFGRWDGSGIIGGERVFGRWMSLAGCLWRGREVDGWMDRCVGMM